MSNRDRDGRRGAGGDRVSVVHMGRSNPGSSEGRDGRDEGEEDGEFGYGEHCCEGEG
jgi:hypothetical protein